MKQGKVDSLNGRRGMVVSLDVEEYERVAELFVFLRVPGDGAPLAFSPLSPRMGSNEVRGVRLHGAYRCQEHVKNQ